ncbi:MAG: acyl-CoA thioesterase [Boseongicola sp.]|nr:acyl-CoA thioesterase [Boseongicola sp.]MDD9976462.1 acyl-CoA thioesterase [Boseongicola sp.]
MYPYLRATYVMVKARRMPEVGLYDTHVSYHRAWPWDTDMFGELNNGRILTLFELGRWQSTVRMGLIRPFLKGGLTLAVAGVSVRYRRRVPVFRKYRMQTQVIGYGERFFYVVQSMWQGDTCCNQMLLRAAIRSKSGTVPPGEFLERMGLPTEQPGMPEWVHAWMKADDTRPWPPVEGPIYDN